MIVSNKSFDENAVTIKIGRCVIGRVKNMKHLRVIIDEQMKLKDR